MSLSDSVSTFASTSAGSSCSRSSSSTSGASAISNASAHAAGAAAIDLRFTDVKAWVPNYTESLADGTKRVVTRTILRGVSGSVHSGGLTMLMGASGAGKSTFFDVVAHRTSAEVHRSGTITVNGSELTLEDFQNNAAYVTQDSFFVGELTVRETLVFQAAVRLPASLAAAEHKARVDDALALLRLKAFEHVQAKALNTTNRKKLAIACALLAKPLLLFCDEPTTSLDSTTARAVVESLRDIASRRRVLVFCTIHQPSVHVFRLFDRVLVMALGQLAYAGPVAELVPRLAAAGHVCATDVNPADFVIELLSASASDRPRVRVVQQVIDSLAEVSTSSHQSEPDGNSDSSAGPRVRLESARRPRAPMLLWHLLVRNVRVTVRNEQALQSNVIQALFFALLLGFLYFASERDQAGAYDRVGFMFLVSTNQLFLSIQSALMVAVFERAVFLKEVADGSYSALEYLLAKAFALIPFQAFYTVLFTAVVYFLVGLQDEFVRWLHFTLLLFAVGVCGSAFGLVISVSTGDMATANNLASAAGIPGMLFSGFLVSIASIPVWLRWIRYTSPLRYALSGLLLNEMNSLTFSCRDSERLASGACAVSSGSQLLDELGATEDGNRLWPHYVGLACMYVAALALAYVVMLVKARGLKRK